MSEIETNKNRLLLIIDDNVAIHDDFRKILPSADDMEVIDSDEAALFGETESPNVYAPFEIDSAYQGQEALDMVKQKVKAGRHYAMAFVDIRMPPGWDGIETVARIWEIDPHIQIVLCTAYSDYSWDDIIEKLGMTDRLLILKKPFDFVEVRQLAESLTEKWNVSKQARIKYDEIEARVTARTNELQAAQAALSVARDEAESANRAKSIFLANMSHEIRTPMTAILGFAENMLEPDQSESDRADAADTIMKNSKHLLTIINDILDLSKIEAGELATETISCSLVEIIVDSVKLIQPIAQKKGLRLDTTLVGSIPDTIESDPTRLRQIILNLLSNSLKFTQQGVISLTISIIKAENGDPMLQIDVTDTGIGMTPDQKANIFKPFQQADKSTTRRFGGTGLGLHISKKLSQALGGDLILVETCKNVGTTFRACVKSGSLVGVNMIDALPSSTAQRYESKSTMTNLTGYHILLAEDSLDNQRLVCFVLNKTGVDVTLAMNGQEAIDKTLTAQNSDKPIDLILMDMQMPEVDGYEATRKLREEGFTIPIIALTAHSMSSDREKCISAGCNEYATKPIDRNALIHTIAQLLEHNRKSNQTTVASGTPCD